MHSISHAHPLPRHFCCALTILLFQLAAYCDEPPVHLSPITVISTPVEDPARVQIDPRAPAQPMPAHDGADLLRAIPGVNVIRKGGIDGDPVLRGMAGSRLGVVLDDQLLLGGCGQRMDPPTAYVFPAAFDRVTLLKGPQSVRHGPGQSAGVVRFERTPHRLTEPDLEARAGLNFGQFQRQDQSLHLIAGAQPGSVLASANHARSDDYEDGDGRRVHSAYSRRSTLAAATWTPDPATRLEVSTAWSDGEAAYADRAMDGVRFARENVAARFERDLDGAGAARRISASLYLNYVDHVMDNFSLRTFAPTAMMPARSVSNPDRLTTGGKAELDLEPTDALHLTLGFDGQSNRHSLRSSTNETVTPYRTRPRLADAKFDQLGGYVEATRELDDTRRIVAGARLDDWHAQDLRTTVRTGMTTSANPTARETRNESLPSGFLRYEIEHGPLAWHLGAGYTERFPDYWELFSKESVSTVSAFATEAEKTAQLDTGLLYRREGVRASLSLFASRVDDFILIESGVPKPAGMGTRQTTLARNVEASTYGGEATWGIDFSDTWSLETSVSAVRGENLTDSLPLAQQPPLEGRLHLAHHSGPWSAGGVLRLVAAQHRYAIRQGNVVGQDLGPSKGFAIVSLHAGRTLGPHARVSVGIDNLFDAIYAEHLSRGGADVAGFPEPTTRVNEPGRTAWVKWDFVY